MAKVSILTCTTTQRKSLIFSILIQCLSQHSRHNTVSWHDPDDDYPLQKAFPRTFLVTGDVTASWLRDSTSQIVSKRQENGAGLLDRKADHEKFKSRIHTCTC